MRLLRTLLVLSALAAPAQAKNVELIYSGQGLTLTARLTRELDKQLGGYELKLSGPGACYSFASTVLGPEGRRIDQLKDVRVDGDLLWVADSCGGGNASKCQGFQLFTLKPQLKHLGYLTGRWDGQALQLHEGAWVYDTGDALEINDLLNHAESPRYAVAYTVAGSALSFDAKKSWELNQELYKKPASGPAGLLYKAGLAKLCGKKSELKAAEAKAKKELPAGAWPLFQRSMLQVTFGHTQPRAFLPVQACEGKR